MVALVAGLGASVLSAPAAVAAPGDITTFAGGGVGDNGPGTSSQLRGPQGIAIDAAGNLYIADGGNNRIRKLTPSGTISTVAGTGGSGYNGDNIPATQALLNSPSDVAVDAAGNLYIADQGNARVRRVDAATGVITTVAGNGIGDDTGDNGPATSAELLPSTLALDPTGHVLYVADFNASRVRKIDLTTGIITAFAGISFDFTFPFFGGDNGPAVDAKIGGPAGLAVDPAGNVYIADQNNLRVRKVDTNGIITTVAGNGEFPTFGAPPVEGIPATQAPLAGTAGVEFFNGQLFFTEPFFPRIRRVDANGLIHTVAGDGNTGYSGDGGQALAAEFNGPNDLAFDAAGNLYVADLGNNRVRRIDTNGIVTTVAGGGVGDLDFRTQAILEGPWGVAVDSASNVYVSEVGTEGFQAGAVSGNRVRKINVNGIVRTVAGTGIPGFSGDGGKATKAQLDNPRGTAVDNLGNLYIADCGNHRVRRVDANGIITTVAGGGMPAAGVGDGGAATAAALSCPSGVFVVTSGTSPAPGTIYIADACPPDPLPCGPAANRVRMVDPSGTITTVAGTGVAGFNGDGIAATSAQLNSPLDVVVDAAGNLYIADHDNNRVRRVDPSGTITTVAGDGKVGFGKDGVQPTASHVVGPSGLTLDPDGNLVIAEAGFARVRKVDLAKNRITTVAGKGVPGFSGDGGPATQALLDLPTDVSYDAAGNLYITDRNNNRVRRVQAGTPPTPPTSGCGAVITRNTTLTADIGPCPGNGIIVGADNVTLDLAGHKVIGTAARQGNHPGILLSGRKGVTVKGGTVKGFDAGVSLIGGSDNTVTNMTVRDNLGGPDTNTSEYGDGIVLFFSARNVIRNNVVTNNGVYDGIGVLGVGASNNLIKDNKVELTTTSAVGGFGFGIGIVINPFLSFDLPRMVSVAGNDLIGNRVLNNQNGGISDISNIGGVVADNIITGNGAVGFAFPGNGLGVQHLMFAEPNTRNLVQNNQIHGNGRNGIDVVNSSKNRILNNDAANNAVSGFGGFDLLDENPACDTNLWSGNIWGSGGFDPPCTTAGGHPAPGTPAAAAKAAGTRAPVQDPPPRAHPPMP